MYGFIVTTHYNNYNIIKKCLDLLFNNIPEESFVVLYVNETTCDKVLNIKNIINKDNFDVIYIEDQIKNNGLTGTWNQGIHYLLNKENFICKVITILGHDSYVNEDIKYLLDAGLKAQEQIEDSEYHKYNKNDLLYFGPLYKNFPGKNDELWQDELHYKNYKNDFIIGSLFTFPKRSLIYNQIDKQQFFNEYKYPFGNNDVDWYNRFKMIDGKGVIITQCIIDHKYERSWISVDKNLK